MRHLAFKYQMKAANHAINHGAYNDGLIYTQAAEELVDRKVEYIVLIEVVQHAIIDLTKMLPKPAPLEKVHFTIQTMVSNNSDNSDQAASEYTEQGFHLKPSPKTLAQHRSASHLSNPYSRSFYAEHESDLKQKINAYVAIKVSCENALAKMKLAESLVPAKVDSSSHGKNSKGKRDIRALLMRKNTSHKLSWQLSTALPQGKYGSDNKEKEKRLSTSSHSHGEAGGVDETPATVRNDSTRFDEEEGLSPDAVSPHQGPTQGCCVIS